jgi:hypothetical protein
VDIGEYSFDIYKKSIEKIVSESWNYYRKANKLFSSSLSF